MSSIPSISLLLDKYSFRILTLILLVMLYRAPPAYSIEFFDDFQKNKIEMPDGSAKLYPNPEIWSFTFRPGIKWPDSYGDGTNFLNGNGECQIYLNPFINKIGGIYLPINDRFDPFNITKDGLHISAKPLSSEQRKLYKATDARIFGSGMISTKFSFKYAKIKVVAKLPAADGSWPAIWMLPTSEKWPPEMDIVEGMPWGQHKGQVHSGYISEESDKTATFGEWYKVSDDLSAKFHTYELNWSEKEIAFKFDDQIVWKKPTPKSMHQEMYLIINLAVGGKWPYNELGVQPIDSVDEKRLQKGSLQIANQYPDTMTIKSVQITPADKD